MKKIRYCMVIAALLYNSSRLCLCVCIFDCEVVSNSLDSQFQNRATWLQWKPIGTIHTAGIFPSSDCFPNISRPSESNIHPAFLPPNYFYVTFIYVMYIAIYSILLYYCIFSMSSPEFYTSILLQLRIHKYDLVNVSILL